MNKWQRKEVKNLIRNIKLNYPRGFGNIIIITEALLRHVDDDLVTSHNFVNMAKFVLAYLCDVLTEIHEANRDCNEDYETSRDRIADEITDTNSYVIHNLFIVFETLWQEIEYLMTATDPQFTNIIAAIYHYYKHKFIKSKNIFLTPDEYFQLAVQALPRLWSLYFQLLIEDDVQEIVYERYDAKVGRRLKIVVKKQYNGWTLSSVYYEDDIYDDDEDGDEWINGMKIPRDIFILDSCF
ncbi:jg23201 [Pararge aegeria aegeria]|uniref:Jg23201 protein n=5 Tax=Pararge aegeria TaxID=116150 RepID=A0A8S4QTD8_9NEOP|nr:jg23201 [Pararge aegeria aegeria]